MTPASPPGNTAGNGLANGVVQRGFNAAAAQAAQQVAALEALYGVGAEPYAGIYPPLHHQAAHVPHTFHKV